MKREFFNKQFAALVNAYTISQKLSAEAQDVYWAMLERIPEQAFANGVRTCLGNNKFFPTIAELGEASLPTKSVPYRYNPHVYREPRQVGWQEQVVGWQEQVKELFDRNEQLPAPIKKIAAPIVSEEVLKLRTEIGDLLDQRQDMLKQIDELKALLNQKKPDPPKISIEERKRILREQAAKLNATEKA